ncbi:phytanoyl-CoA dioxygenase family protein [Streptomyces sp. CA-251387]|uniref:phytanoyl-CoA dioxygenase family protein n=1 Tax=Streptomyces sp. CA-251387 TaxID=3240064 RepID=UPI003D8EA129
MERLISQEECEETRAGVTPLLNSTGRNSFEGERTQRVYSVLDKTRACDRLIDHPRILALLDRLLLPNSLLSQLQVININAGESGQLLHPDAGFYPLPRPRPPLSAATVWAIDPFTEENGATVVLPSSHRWDDERRPGDDDQRVAATMPPGACVFFIGTLWHGGGANRSDHNRLAVTAQYCEPWLRPQEAFTLSTPVSPPGLSPKTSAACSATASTRRSSERSTECTPSACWKPPPPDRSSRWPTAVVRATLPAAECRHRRLPGPFGYQQIPRFYPVPILAISKLQRPSTWHGSQQ